MSTGPKEKAALVPKLERYCNEVEVQLVLQEATIAREGVKRRQQ